MIDIVLIEIEFSKPVGFVLLTHNSYYLKGNPAGKLQKTINLLCWKYHQRSNSKLWLNVFQGINSRSTDDDWWWKTPLILHSLVQSLDQVKILKVNNITQHWRCWCFLIRIIMYRVVWKEIWRENTEIGFIKCVDNQLYFYNICIGQKIFHDKKRQIMKYYYYL